MQKTKILAALLSTIFTAHHLPAIASSQPKTNKKQQIERIDSSIRSLSLPATEPEINRDKHAAGKSAPIKFDISLISGTTLSSKQSSPRIEDIYKEIDKLLGENKDEFEPAKLFAQRIESITKTGLKSGYTTSDIIAFDIPVSKRTTLSEIWYEYFPEWDEFRIYKRAMQGRSIGSRVPPEYFDGDFSSWEVLEAESGEYRREFINFISPAGLIVEGTIARVEKYGFISKKSIERYEEVDQQTGLKKILLGSIPAPPEEARKIAPSLRALIVFKPTSPYIVKYLSTLPATLPKEGALDVRFGGPTDLRTTYNLLTGSIEGIVIYTASDSKIHARKPENFGLATFATPNTN